MLNSADSPLNRASALTRLGKIERDLGHIDAALVHYEAAADLYRLAGDSMRFAHTIRHVADMNQDAGRNQVAEPLYYEALRYYRNNHRTRPLDLANTLRGLAILKQDTGEVEEAKILWEEARDLYAAVNVEAGVTESSLRLASL